MSMGTLMQGLTASHVATFAEDFGRFLQRGPHTRKHSLVLALARTAEGAAQSGDGVQGAFLHGVAAALYGVSRLAEAQELEDIVRPRLERPDSAAEHSSHQIVLQKEQTMADTMQAFSVQDLVEHVKADGFSYTLNEEHAVVTATLPTTEAGTLQFFGHVDEDRSVMILTYRLPMPIPANKQAVMMEAIVDANFRLLLGCFDLHRESGTMLFQIAIPTDDVLVSLSQYRHCMIAALATIGHYWPKFMRILFGGTDSNDVTQSSES
ncbi:MAG: hypothetical protein QUV05_20150 [Phycisphaerae bacterium]|nr:hypothetical protein [Phycisphaerae bacterium]